MDRYSALAALFLVVAPVTACTDRGANSIKADLNGDGILDLITLNQSSKVVALAVQPGGASASNILRLSFGVDPARQDAICALPAKLDVFPLSCEAMDEPLPGCKIGNSAQALVLSGGECDPIHLYWDHQAKELAWWRL